MKINSNLIEIACEAYYSDDSGLVKWTTTTDYMASRMWLGMEAMLEKVVPLIAAGERVNSQKVMLVALDGAFNVWCERENAWSLWVAHYGPEQYEVYAPAFKKALTAVFGE